MKVFLFFLICLISSWAAAGESVSLSRYFAIRSCFEGQKECTGPVVKQIEFANSDIELEPFRKLTSKGFDGRELQNLTVEGIRFKSEIHVIKHSDPGKYKYFIYVMIKAGKRNGKIKTINLKDLSELKKISLTDHPIQVKGSTLQAQFIVGPKINMNE